MIVIIVSTFGFLNDISPISSYAVSAWNKAYESGRDLTAELTITYTNGYTITRPFIEGKDGHLEPTLEKKYYMFVRQSTNLIFGSFDNATQTMNIISGITSIGAILPIIQLIQDYKHNNNRNTYYSGNYPRIFTVKL